MAKTKTASDRRLDIFEVMNAIDRHDIHFLDRLPPERAKGFVPVVALRWASIASDSLVADALLILINERVNHHGFDLADYPDLFFKVMATCGMGRTRHHWIAPAKGTRSPSRLRAFFEEQFPDANEEEIDLLHSLSKPQVFEDYLDDLGIDKSEAKELLALIGKMQADE